MRVSANESDSESESMREYIEGVTGRGGRERTGEREIVWGGERQRQRSERVRQRKRERQNERERATIVRETARKRERPSEREEK